MIVLARADGRLSVGNLDIRCVLGRSGVIAAVDKREGDGASPLGVWPIRRVLYRPDRMAPPETQLPCLTFAADDGWCDAPNDPAYNMPVKLPYGASAEELWREEHVYDVIVVLGYNDEPVKPGAGSAIFWHLARPDYSPTEGCVAVAREDMLAALRILGPGAAVEIARAENG
jgi:L,D-peptidoglycan transpeptidase YkuD (ErfK/YbiS/YcfS/YnhG family)